MRDGYINVDIDPRVRPDIQCDLRRLPYIAGMVDKIYMAHTIEHFTDEQVIEEVIPEMWRVLRVGGEFECVTPIAGSFEAFQDPDHKSYWVPQKFLYFTSHFDGIIHRDYEQRFQLRYWEFDHREVRVWLTKVAQREECACPICRLHTEVGVEAHNVDNPA